MAYIGPNTQFLVPADNTRYQLFRNAIKCPVAENSTSRELYKCIIKMSSLSPDKPAANMIPVHR